MTDSNTINTGTKFKITIYSRDPDMFNVLNAVTGQLSDGLWENDRKMRKYWEFSDVCIDADSIYIEFDSRSAFSRMSSYDIREFFAERIADVLDAHREHHPHAIGTDRCSYLMSYTRYECQRMRLDLLECNEVGE